VPKRIFGRATAQDVFENQSPKPNHFQKHPVLSATKNFEGFAKKEH